MKQIKIDKKKIRFVVFVSFMVILCCAVLWCIFSPVTVAETSGKKIGGLNMQLPAANVGGDTVKDKLSFYSVALQDSLKRAEQIRMDPYRRDSVIGQVQVINGNDPLEARVKTIQRQMVASAFTDYPVADKKSSSNELERPRKIVQPVADPEMEAINTTLDKIMAIQNPQKPVDVVTARNSFAVSAGEGADTTYFGKRSPRKSAPVFYQEAGGSVGDAKAIAAVIPTEQILRSGSVVKLELGVAVVVNGVAMPAGTNVFGIASLEAERLMIVIPSIQYQNNLLPVSLTVYDMDGLEGIRMPGSLFRDVAKASTDNAIQSVGSVAGFDFSLKTQIAAAGIGAAKSLLSKKVKQVTVTVTAGYQVLLRDNKQSDR